MIFSIVNPAGDEDTVYSSEGEGTLAFGFYSPVFSWFLGNDVFYCTINTPFNDLALLIQVLNFFFSFFHIIIYAF